MPVGGVIQKVFIMQKAMKKSVAEGTAVIILITVTLLVTAVAFSMVVKYLVPAVKGLANVYVFDTSVSNVNSCYLNSAERCSFFLVVPIKTNIVLECSREGTKISNGEKDVTIPYVCQQEKKIEFNRVGIYYVKLY